MAAIFYARVSTADQTLDHQITQARSAGFHIDEVVADLGVSGVKHKLIERPEGRRLYDILRHGDDLIVRWTDRIGRDYSDVTDVIRHFIRKGVTIRTVIGRMVFDGSTVDPIQMAIRDTMVAFLAATAQAQAEATKIAQRAGIDAVLNDPRKYPGRRPSYDRPTVDTVKALSTHGLGASAISKHTGLSRQTVIRIQQDPAGVEEALLRWSM
jgi:putative DNA-invertase from lambdoid prophage Rac